MQLILMGFAFCFNNVYIKTDERTDRWTDSMSKIITFQSVYNQKKKKLQIISGIKTFNALIKFMFILLTTIKKKEKKL